MARPPKTLTKDDINALANTLSEVPPKPKNFTIPEVISELKPQISALRSNGYSWNEIKNILAERGVKTTIAALSGKRRDRKSVQQKSAKSSDGHEQ